MFDSCAIVNPDLIKTTNTNIKFDHYPVIFNAPYTSRSPDNFNKSKSQVRSWRNLKQIDFSTFNDVLHDKLSSVGTTSNFKDQLTEYNNCLVSTLDRFAPAAPKT